MVGILLIANLFIWQAEIRAGEHSGFLTIAFLDVGQGDAIYIEGPTGNQVLVDGGPSGQVLSELSKIIPFSDKTIDMLVVTNPDQDHFAGFLDILNIYDVSYMLEPGTRTPNGMYKELKKILSEKEIKTTIAQRGMIIDLGGGAYLKIQFPDRVASNMSRNDGSIVMRLEYGSTSVMLTGDTTKIIEEYLVNKYPNELDSDILKVAHHGSKTSTSRNFVNAVSPDIAVISLGESNSYGHPHEEVLHTLSAADVDTLRTDIDHTIIFVSDGEQFYRKN